MSSINIQIEQQQSYVADEVSALVAVVRPILQGLLFAIKHDVANEAGGVENLKLFMLPRVYRPGAGDCGICFEYAVHDAILRKDPMVVERIHDSLTRHCRVPGIDTASILFGAEKTGALQIIGNAGHLLTDESRVLTGAQAQPPKLKQYVKDLTQRSADNHIETNCRAALLVYGKLICFLVTETLIDGSEQRSR